MKFLLALLLVLPWSPGAPGAPGAMTATNDAEAAVLEDFRALGSGDVDGLAAVFAPRFTMHRLPVEAHTLVGPPSSRMRTREELRAYFREAFVARPPAPHQVLAMASVDELVVVRVAAQLAVDAPPDHAFTAFRVRDGLIEAVWHIAREPGAAQDSGADALRTVRQLVDAHNRGDADAFVALYHRDARHSHVRDDPTRLGGGPARQTSDPERRRRFYRELYAKAPPTPVEIVASVALGEWVATRERYREPDGSRRDHLTVYRVRDGLIIDDWHLAP